MTETKSISTSADVLKLLQEQGKTRSEIARLMGVCVSYLSRVASGERNFTLDHLRQLADGFDMTLPELITLATPINSVPAHLRESYRQFLEGMQALTSLRASLPKTKSSGKTKAIA
jgi:transcriptional regulator with XRE-family HTH domain